MPEPPTVGFDPRQSGFQNVVDVLTDATREWGQMRTANLVTGDHASAPSLGVIKSVHEQALARFDMRIARGRWNEDLQRWLGKSLMRWVQRTKRISIELRANGIAVDLEAQDDHGYYRYGFDIMLRAVART